jgi:hypothetical protein
MKKTLANKLIDKRIEEYVSLNRKNPKSSSDRVSVLGGYLKRQHNNNNKTVSQAIEERRLYSNATRVNFFIDHED